MHASKSYLARFKEADVGPGSVSAEYGAIWPPYFYGFLVPIVFIVVKLLRVQLLPESVALKLLEGLSTIAPVLQQHGLTLQTRGQIIDLANYPAFILIAFGVACIPMLTLVKIYIRKWRIMMSPHPAGVVLMTIIFALYYALIINQSDWASLSFRSIYQLYFDQFGIYYLRQYCAIFIYCFGLLFLLLNILHSFSAAARCLSRRINVEHKQAADGE